MITFDEEKHEYWLDGRRIPSVTEILFEAGIVNRDFYTEESATRGKHIHQACHYFDDGDLYMESLAEQYRPYVEAYKKFINECRPEWEHIEKIIYNKNWNYAGTLDRAGKIFGIPSVCDIKTGAVPPWTGLQLAGYAEGLISDNPYHFDRYAVQLKEDGDYKIKKFDFGNDFTVFRCACSIVNWKLNERIIK